MYTPLIAAIGVVLASTIAATSSIIVALINQGAKIKFLEKTVDEHDQVINHDLNKRLDELMSMRKDADEHS